MNLLKEGLGFSMVDGLDSYNGRRWTLDSGRCTWHTSVEMQANDTPSVLQ